MISINKVLNHVLKPKLQPRHNSLGSFRNLIATAIVTALTAFVDNFHNIKDRDVDTIVTATVI